MICDKTLSGQVGANCSEYPLTKGFEQDGIIMPRSNIDFGASTIGDTTAAIVMKSRTSGIPVKQIFNQPFNGSEMSLNVGTYVSTWNKNINVLLMSVGPNTSSIVNALVNTDCVLILRNKAKHDAQEGKMAENDAASEYEIFGLEQGLKVSAGTRTPYDEETLGGTLLTLTETGADSHGKFLWDTDKTTTDAMYQSLLTPSN